jgi:hypothetical protein
MERLDALLRPPAVPQRLTRRPDGTLQGGIADVLARPHLRTQLLPGHDAVAMGHQVDEELEYFGPEADGASGAVQSIETGIERTVPKDIEHG